SPGLLAFYAGLARIGAGRDGLNRAQQATHQLPPNVQNAARAALTAARDLPQAELEARIGPAAAERADSQRGAVRARIEGDIAGVPASMQGLDALAAMRNALARDYATVFPPADMTALTQALAARETAIGTDIADAVVADIEAAPDGMPAFDTIGSYTAGPLLSRLPPPQAARIRAAADAKAAKVGEALLPTFRKNLADLPVEDASIDNLDGPTLAYVRQSLAPAPTLQPLFQKEVATRRAEIIAALDKAEAGTLRGRHYADRHGQVKLEFVDRTR